MSAPAATVPVPEEDIKSPDNPLWQDSGTVPAEEQVEPSDLVRRINERAKQLTKVCGGPTKTPFSLFHTNLKPDMCYVEDIYHSQCGHWADKPRIYHRCANAPEEPSKSCFNRKTVGSANEDSTCAKCLTDIEAAVATEKETKCKPSHRHGVKKGRKEYSRAAKSVGCHLWPKCFKHAYHKGSKMKGHKKEYKKTSKKGKAKEEDDAE